MKTLIAIVCALLVFGCADTVPLQHTTDYKTMTITWVRTWPSNPAGGACGSGDAVGCAKRTSPTSCTIWAVEPTSIQDTNRMDTIGHEVLHCFLGKFHD